MLSLAARGPHLGLRQRHRFSSVAGSDGLTSLDVPGGTGARRSRCGDFFGGGRVGLAFSPLAPGFGLTGGVSKNCA